MKAAAAYIPVLHRGHEQFCRKVQPNVLYVLGKTFLDELEILKRDMRALDPLDIVSAARALELAPEVSILEKTDIPRLIGADTIVFADDEVMRHVAEQYLHDKKVIFEQVFLRWDKMSAITPSLVSPDITISREELDKNFMQE